MMMAKIVQRSELYLSGHENMIRKDMCEYDGDYNGDDESSGSHDYENFCKGSRWSKMGRLLGFGPTLYPCQTEM